MTADRDEATDEARNEGVERALRARRRKLVFRTVGLLTVAWLLPVLLFTLLFVLWLLLFD